MPPLCVNLIITIFCFLVSSPTSHGADDEFYTTCHEKTYDCGEQIKGIGYPFWGEDRPPFCGVQGFKLTCKGNENTTIVIEKQEFRVLHINQSAYSMTIARADLWDTICPAKFINTTLNWNLFDYGPHPHVLNLTLFYDWLPDLASYDHIQERSHFNTTVEELVKQGFEADYHELDKIQACNLCNASGGECGTNTTMEAIVN
ncbi:LEAF RUST 10 DISEASE-RESISTANCE LOCUS RECEPTOR-LIKE PROTEIN KINASE-like 1.4 [Camellia lanceoleosa]|uniref:LEAF RUST 10 DISEASE-RESISTANCE LOCUS RECEPTOR-LIKE PROTEIN KINASE-like 1.4 n=1 Tax=Camellia lanceoleosa TaxID=1840588 RepID=A0ACC0F9X3_9ERIC|nr:LEAF RUST 10 DISEASE-RESISTANCE LOCUS RECEPTOR-LIKE PROTEIN KINASE-like 1.4 [Camellia lanceoleosa]